MGIEQTKFGFDNQIRMRSDFCGHPDGYGEAEVRKRQLCEYTLFNNLKSKLYPMGSQCTKDIIIIIKNTQL